MTKRTRNKNRRAPNSGQRNESEYGVTGVTVRRTRRTDQIVLLRQKYVGDVSADPNTYNRAFADVLRKMADAIAEVTDAWVDPEVVVWMHAKGEITAEVMLSPQA